MKRTISVMLGKGSVNHNTRQFKAENVDAERTRFNTTYCNTPIRDVYHELFNIALKRYNAKQTRADRCIDDYYEKIRTSKQERPFKEVIFQVGKMDDMSAKSEDGQLAAKILDEFMQSFQGRNPNLKVFSAHLHMDEATPHLHVDFVPFITGSKRGLDTRVSLKQALAAQGFTGGTRFDTEWNQWIDSEKQQLSQIMERHGIEWEQLGTHRKHRSVEIFKIEEREKEVAALDKTIEKKRDEFLFLTEHKVNAKNELDDFLSELENTEAKLKIVKEKEDFIARSAGHYDDDPEYQLPEPKPLIYAKAYRDKYAAPVVRKLKDALRRNLLQLIEKTQEYRSAIDRANNQIRSLSDRVRRLEPEVEQLRGIEKNYNRVRQFLGGERTDEIINDVKALEEIRAQEKSRVQEIARNRPKIKRDYAR